MWFNATGEESSREENLAALGHGQGPPPAAPVQRPHHQHLRRRLRRAVHVQRRRPTTAPRSRCRRASWPRSTTARSSKLFEYLDSGKFGAPVMNEYEIRELCEAFFDAYENRRVDVLDRSMPTTASSGTTSSAARPPATRTSRATRRLRGPAPAHLQRPHLNTFDDGFVIQYTLNGVHAHRSPRRAVDLHRRPLPRREDHPHRRVHGLVEVRGVGRTLARGPTR